MRLSVFLPLAALVAAPATAAPGDAAAGLAAIKKYNLIVIEDMTAGHDVEGKTLIGRDLLGGSATFGLGSSANGQSAAPSTGPTLIVGRDNKLSNTNVNNGNNGLLGKVATGSSIWVGGNNSGNANFNGAGPHDILVGGNLGGNPNVNGGDTLNVGGNVTGMINLNGGAVKLGGHANGANFNSGTYSHDLGAGFQAGLTAQVTDTTSQVSADVRALSTTLKGLTVIDMSTTSSNADTLFLNAVDGGNGFALFNLDSTLFGTKTKIDYNFPTTTLPIIVNVSGTNISFDMHMVGGAGAAANQQIIWNFYEATSLSFSKLFHGSVLAPYATLSNVTPIEGSVVALSFNQGGEVHLGTYQGNDSFLTPPPPAAVPEPASWALMIAGLGLVGASMRRRQALHFA